MLHIKLNKFRRTRKQIKTMKIEGRFSKRKDSFDPTPHNLWISALEENIEDLGIDAFGWKFLTSDYYGNDSEMHGSFDFMLEGDEKELPGKQASRSLGWSISNGGRHRPRFFIGGRFGTEGAGGFAAEMVEFQKHSGVNIELSIAGLFMGLKDKCREIDKKVTKMVESPLWHSDRSMIIIEAARRGIVPWSRLKACDNFCTNNEVRKEENLWWHLIRGFGLSIAKNTSLKQLGQLSQAWDLVWDWHEWKDEQDAESEDAVEIGA